MKHLSTLIAVKKLTIIQFNQLLLFVFNIKITIMNIFLTKQNKIYIFLLINVIINLSI